MAEDSLRALHDPLTLSPICVIGRHTACLDRYIIPRDPDSGGVPLPFQWPDPSLGRLLKGKLMFGNAT